MNNNTRTIVVAGIGSMLEMHRFVIYILAAPVSAISAFICFLVNIKILEHIIYD